MSNKTVIAIDGPAGAGKSTVARIVADRLRLKILDTGAMYRCVALKAIESDGTDEHELAEIARKMALEFRSGEPQGVSLDGIDVTDAIRTLAIGQRASELSVFTLVRRALVDRQQDMIREGGYVLEGRDVTTVVAPGAQVKVFLTASIEERARRRWLETGTETLQAVVKDVVARDHRDYTRDDSPLTLAEDAVIIETFALTPQQVAEQIIALAESTQMR